MENVKHYPTHPGAEHPPIMTCEIPLEEYESIKRENAELKAKLESVQASAYAESVDAGMRERKLKRALYKACANWAKSERYTEATWHGDQHREKLWANVERKCRAKEKEYK